MDIGYEVRINPVLKDRPRMKTRNRKYNVEEIEHKLGKHTCSFCGYNRKLTIDHIIPISKSGLDGLANFDILCDRCNREKDNKILVPYAIGCRFTDIQELFARIDRSVPKEYKQAVFTSCFLSELDYHKVVLWRDLEKALEYFEVYRISPVLIRRELRQYAREHIPRFVPVEHKFVIRYDPVFVLPEGINQLYFNNFRG
jgi:hypothetical protein